MMISRGNRCGSRSASGGFSLIEVMAAIMILGVSMVVMLDLRNQALDRATVARSLSVATRLGVHLLHRVEGARVADLYDGYQGDFADEGYPEFYYQIGVGDGSAYSSAGAITDETEFIWRLAKREESEDREEDEEDDKPPFTRVFIHVYYPVPGKERRTYTIETVLPSWAVFQDIEMYEEQWPDNSPATFK